MKEEDYSQRLGQLKRTIQEYRAVQKRITEKIDSLVAEEAHLRLNYDLLTINANVDVNTWKERNFEWSDKVHTILREVFKFESFRMEQLAAINATLSNQDVLLLMPTGGGKSLVYQLPALVDKGLTVVISPLIALIEDQLMALQKLGIEAATINGNTARSERNVIHNMMNTRDSNLRVLFVTPEWITKSKIFMSHLQKSYEKHLLVRIVIDEAHCCSTWGHDFRPEYQQLGLFKSMFPEVPILGLTATATMDILVDIKKILNLESHVIFTTPFNRANLFYKVVFKPEKNECVDKIANWMKTRYKNMSGIIYTSTVKETEELSAALVERGLKVKHYHAQMEPEHKSIVHKRWLENRYQAVVATIAFGMGIDKPDVRFVIHHAIPKSLESFYQESGRAGRDGKRSDCIVMFGLTDYLKHHSNANRPAEEQQARNILAYCLEKTRCRREVIMEHFKDTYQPSDCDRMCDICRNPTPMITYTLNGVLENIIKLIKYSCQKETKLTLLKLLKIWNSQSKRSICTREQQEYVIGYLIYEHYLAVDRGYSMYSNLAYIQLGPFAAKPSKISMSHPDCFNMPGVARDTDDESSVIVVSDSPTNDSDTISETCSSQPEQLTGTSGSSQDNAQFLAEINTMLLKDTNENVTDNSQSSTPKSTRGTKRSIEEDESSNSKSHKIEECDGFLCYTKEVCLVESAGSTENAESTLVTCSLLYKEHKN